MITRSKAIEGDREVTNDIRETGAYKTGLLKVVKGKYNKKAEFFRSVEWIVKQVPLLPLSS
jgi:hypothetical protein